MNAASLKNLLASFVGEEESGFEVVFSYRRTSRRAGSYNSKTKRITLYPKCIRDNKINLIGAGLRELAHHLFGHGIGDTPPIS
jgi:hypothetical protein